jgi:hypothetical protein
MVGNMKPCPHCGGVPELHQGHADITYVLCHDCGAVTSFRPNLKGRATVEAWNRRPPPPKVNSDMHMASSVRDCLAASAPETFPALDNMAQRIAVIATGCRDKEPEQLTDQERIALAIVGGCAWERTDTGIRVTDAFGIQKVDGKFIVARRPL